MINVYHSTKQNALATKLQSKEVLMPRETLREEGQVTSKLAGFIKECAKLNDLAKGIEIEHEHAPTYQLLQRVVAKTGKLPKDTAMYYSIASDHLNEFENYYKRLPAFEKSLSKLGGLYLTKYAMPLMFKKLLPLARDTASEVKGLFSGQAPRAIQQTVKHPTQLLASDVHPGMVNILNKYKQEHAALTAPRKLQPSAPFFKQPLNPHFENAISARAGGSLAYA